MRLFGIKEYQEEQQEYWEEEYQRYEEGKIDDKVSGYVSFLEKAYEVHEKAVSEKKIALYNFVTYIQNQMVLLESYLEVGCETLFDTLHETTQDLESSVFLAIHGRYEPAMGLLRRHLETTLCSLYFDSKLVAMSACLSGVIVSSFPMAALMSPLASSAILLASSLVSGIPSPFAL